MSGAAYGPVQPHVAVAASGGRDSTALLHCTARFASGCGLTVHALHVHHGLHPDADAWALHLARQVQRWSRAGLPLHLHVQRLAGAPQRGQSVEAWAREQRYAALASMAHAAGCSLVLLAQHRRDQAETVLLQALRGAGPAGLAAMPRAASREGIEWVRPWLNQPREAIEAYLRRHRLSFVDDASNADPRFARNRLRQSVWPAFTAAFPDAEAALAAVARHSQTALECLDELAAADLASVCDGAALRVDRWLNLTRARRANALKHWLDGMLPAGAPGSLLERLMHELPPGLGRIWPAAGGCLRLHRRALRLHPEVVPDRDLPPEPLPADLSRPGRHRLAGWGGAIVVEPALQGGIEPLRLKRALCLPRAGGESFQSALDRPSRSLKKMYQDRDIATWQRGGPLVFIDGSLVFVPGLGIDARWHAEPGMKQVTLRWERDSSLAVK